MRVKFKQAVHLGGRDYLLGTHEVPDQLLKHPYFQKLMKAGLVEDAEPLKKAHAESPEHRQKKISEKIASLSQDPPQDAPPADGQKDPESPGPSAEPQAGEEDGDPESSDSHEEPSSKKQKHKHKR